MVLNKQDFKSGGLVFAQASNTLSVVANAALKADDFVGKQLIALNLVPAIVLKSFACELFLKGLAVNNVLKEHRLDILFNNISFEDKNYIIKSVCNNIKNNTNSEYDTNQFNDDLQNIANAFVDWRYFFESKRTIKILFLDALFEVLRQYKIK